MNGPWNSGDQWNRIDDIEGNLPLDDGDGTASVKMNASDTKAAKAKAAR